MNISRKRDALPILLAMQEDAVSREFWRCCLNCINWNNSKEICEKFNARPPAKIIVLACVDHEFDIPF